MNKKTILLTMTAILVAVSLISCEDDMFTESSVKNQGKGISIQTTLHQYTGLWNPNNPHDSLGYWHNEALDYYINNRDHIDPDYFVDSLKSVFEAHFISHGYTSNDILNAYNGIDDINDYGSKSEALDSLVTGVSANTKMHELFDLINTYDASNVLNVIADIKELEDDIDTTFSSGAEKIQLLSACAVAKFSMKYWDEVENDSNNEWHDLDDNDQNFEYCLDYETITIITSDVIGYYYGGLIGAATSSAFTAAYFYGDEILDVIWDTVSSVWDWITGP